MQLQSEVAQLLAAGKRPEEVRAALESRFLRSSINSAIWMARKPTMTLQEQVTELLAQGLTRDEVFATLLRPFSRRQINQAMYRIETPNRHAKAKAKAAARKPPKREIRWVGDLVEVAPGHLMRPEWAAFLGYMEQGA